MNIFGDGEQNSSMDKSILVAMATGMRLLIILLSLLAVITMGARVKRASKFILPPKNNGGKTRSCTYNNRAGICVHESACDEEHRIWEGGVVDYIDFRGAKQCKQYEWCCITATTPDNPLTDDQTTVRHTTDEQTTDSQTTAIWTTDRSTTEKPDPPIDVANENNNCVAPETDVCPWCVLLYRSSGGGQIAENPFCLGALIGSKAIITASTCLKTAYDKTLYAQLPNSSDPGKNYTILQRRLHPLYNTGTRAYDIGLLVMESDATLQKSQGACLDFLEPFKGDCVGYGFDINWQIYSTILEVKDKSCSSAGNTVADAACGTNADAVCLVNFGAPILCPMDDNRLVLRGIARGRCDSNDKMLLGGIARSNRWIEEELASMNIRRDSYTLA